MLVPLTGPFTPTGKQLVAGAKLYMQRNGDTVAGKKIVLIIKDDTGNPDMTKRLAQELVVNDKVALLAGFGLTPGALATAPIATEAKIPEIVMMAATSVITTRSPYIVRTSFSVPQTTVPLADWAAKNGIKTGGDGGVGLCARHRRGNRIQAALRSARRQSDRILAGPAGQSRLRAGASACRGRETRRADGLRSGRRRADLHSTVRRTRLGQIRHQVHRRRQLDGRRHRQSDRQMLRSASSPTHHYSAAHNSPENKSFVADFKKANSGMRPNLMAVQSYDGMHLIYEALKKTKGATDGDALVDCDEGP